MKTTLSSMLFLLMAVPASAHDWFQGWNVPKCEYQPAFERARDVERLCYDQQLMLIEQERMSMITGTWQRYNSPISGHARPLPAAAPRRPARESAPDSGTEVHSDLPKIEN